MAPAKKNAKTAAEATPATKVEAAEKAVKKEAAKTEAVKAEAEKKEPAKRGTAKKAELKVEVELQLNNDQKYTPDDLVNKAKEIWTNELAQKAEDLKEIKLYVKPDEKKVYYVLNDISGEDKFFEI